MERPGSVPCLPVMSVRMKTICAKAPQAHRQAWGDHGRCPEREPYVDTVNRPRIRRRLKQRDRVT